MADDLQLRFGAETSGVEAGGKRTKSAVIDVRTETEKATKSADALRAAVGRMFAPPSDGLATGSDRAARSVSNLSRHSREAASSVDRLERESAEAGRAAGQAAAQIDRASQASGRFSGTARSAQGATALFAAALGTLGIRQIGGDLSDAAFAGQGFETALRATTDGARGGAEAISFIEDKAAELGLVVRDATNGFIGLTGATNGTRLEGQATRDIWEGLIIGGVALNRSNEQLKRGQEALTQIASKGVVSMEEIRQQLSEAIPGAMNIGARAMGMTSAAFIKMVGEGKLLSEDFLPKFAAQLRREFGPALEESLNTPLGRARRGLAEFSNATFEAKQAAGGAFLAEMAAGLKSVNDELRSEEGLETARDLGAALGQTITAAAHAAVFLAKNIDNVVMAAQMLAAVALTRWLVVTAAEARAAAGAYAVKAMAAKSAASVGAASAAVEGAANVTLSGQIMAAARAEVLKAEAGLAAARVTLAVANATAAEARSTLAATGAGVAYVDAKIALTAANAALIRAEGGVIAAAAGVTVAQNAAAVSSTRLGAAMLAARGAMAGLLALVGGPWGAAFLAAAGVVYVLTAGLRKQAEVEAEVRDRVNEKFEAMEAARRSAQQARIDTGNLTTAEMAAAVQAAKTTGEQDKLADAYWRVAAAAKAAALAQNAKDLLQAEADVLRSGVAQRGANGRLGAAIGARAAIGAAANPLVERYGNGVRSANETAERAVAVRDGLAAQRGEIREMGLEGFAGARPGAGGGAGAGGSGSSGPGAVARWQQELDERLTAEENYFRDSRDAELAFWIEKRAMTTAGSSERLEVDRKIFGLRKQLAEEDLRAQLEALDTQQQAAAGDLAEQMRIQDEKLILLREAYGEDSREYERASQDKIRLEQQLAAEILAMRQETIRANADFAAADAEAAAEVSRYRLDDERSTIDALATMGRISDAERRERLNAIAAEERRIEADTANRVFDIQKRALDLQLEAEGLKPQARAAILAEIERLEREHAARMGVLVAGQASDLKREADAAIVDGFNKWKSAIDPIGNGFGSLVNNLVTGARSVREVWAEVGQSLLNNVTGYISKVVTNWIASQLAMTTAHAAAETTKTAATAVGAGVRTGIETTAAATSIATSGAVTLADVANSAIRAAAGAYAAIAGIPVVGPILAPMAAAAALAAVLALGKSIFSAKGGAERVANDGDIYELHRDEMVLPAKIANPLRSMVGSLGVPEAGAATRAAYAGVGSAREEDVAERRSMADSLAALQSVAGRGGGSPTTINAVDAKSVQRLFRENAKSTQKSLERRARNLQTRKPK